jgi:hypothetical protein
MVNLATVLLPMILFSVGVGASGQAAITSAIITDPRMIGADSGLYADDQRRTVRLGSRHFSGQPRLMRR